MNPTLNDNGFGKRYEQKTFSFEERPLQRSLPFGKLQNGTKKEIEEVVDNEHDKDPPKYIQTELKFSKKDTGNKHFKDCPVYTQKDLPFKEKISEDRQKGPKLTFLEERNHVIANKKTIIDKATEQINCREKDVIKHSLDAAFNKRVHCNDLDTAKKFLNNPEEELRIFWEENKWLFIQSERSSRGSRHIASETHEKHFGPMVLGKVLKQINFFDKQYLYKNLRIILHNIIDNEDENLLLDPVGYLVDIWGLNKWQIIRADQTYQQRVLLKANEEILWNRKDIKDEILRNGIQEFIRTENEEFLTSPIEKLKEYFEAKRPASYHRNYD